VPVVANGPVALVMYSSYAASKYAGSVKLSKVVTPGITSYLFMLQLPSSTTSIYILTRAGRKCGPANSLPH
jgi:hypothetical protein